MFIIAGRQGALLQLVHEGAHKLIVKNKKLNDLIGNWVCGGPIGISMTQYRMDHGKHHNYPNTDLDAPSDLEKYTVTNIASPSLWILFIKDITGISAINRIYGILFNKEKSSENSLKELLITLTSQIIILMILNGNIILYLILWIVPLFTANMVLMRIRGIAEHGMPGQLNFNVTDGNQGKILTRSLNSNHATTNFLSKNIEKVLIGSLSINYHLEHHVIPNIPHYNLKKLHKILNLYSINELRDNYKSGYLSSLFQFTK